MLNVASFAVQNSLVPVGANQPTRNRIESWARPDCAIAGAIEAERTRNPNTSRPGRLMGPLRRHSKQSRWGGRVQAPSHGTKGGKDPFCAARGPRTVTRDG